MGDTLAIHGGKPVRTAGFGPGHDFGEDDVEAVAEVIRSGNVGRGPVVERFEGAFAERHGVEWVITVNSGTSAMHTCIGAVNPDPGDEIIVSPWTSGGSIIGALLHNCVPIFADIDETYTLDPADVEAKITPRTRAIIAVHLFGNVCDMTALRDIADRHGIFLIEDACQAHLAEHQGQIVGSMGDIAGISFGGKTLSAGMGGAVLTSNRALWERAILFRDAALPRDKTTLEGMPYANYFLAPNYKINDILAALLLNQLGKLDGYVENKVRSATNIIEGLSDVDEIAPQVVKPGDRHTYWNLGFTIDTDALSCTANDFAAAVSAEGVPMGGPYVGSGDEGPLYRNPFLAEPNLYGKTRFPLDYGRERPVDYRQVECPKGEALMNRGVGLTMIPNFTEDDLADMIQATRKVADAARDGALAQP